MSHPIEVHVTISIADAIKAATTRHGADIVRPTAEQLGALTEEQREWLKPYLCDHQATHRECCASPYRRVAVNNATWEAVIATWESTKEQLAAERAAETVDLERRVAAALAAPITDWTSRDGAVLVGPGGYPGNAVAADPRIIAHRAAIADLCHAHAQERMREQLAKLLARPLSADVYGSGDRIGTNIDSGWNEWSSPGGALDADWQAARKARIAAVDREVLAPRRAAAERFAEQARAYVIAHVPDFARAAREGLNVNKPARAATIAELKARLVSAGLTLVSEDDVFKWREQELPRSLAYETLDKVLAIVEPAAAAHPLIRAIETEIRRGDMCPHNSRQEWRTFVTVTVQFGDNGDAKTETNEDIHVCAEESCARGGDDDGESDDD